MEIKTRILNRPFGKFSVEVLDEENEEYNVRFFRDKIVKKPSWRAVDEYGGYCTLGEQIKFDSLSEAKLFEKWLHKNKLCD